MINGLIKISIIVDNIMIVYSLAYAVSSVINIFRFGFSHTYVLDILFGLGLAAIYVMLKTFKRRSIK